MAAKKKKAAAKPPKAAKKPKAAKQSRREASDAGPGGLGHNLPPDEFQEKLETALTELMDLQTAMESDMAGYRGDFKAAYENHSKGLGIRQNVLKEEFRRALAIKKQVEKEKAYDPIERAQREAIRAATANSKESWGGTPLGDLFAGVMAAPADGDGEEVVETEAEEKEAAE